MEKTVKHSAFLLLLFCLAAFNCNKAFTGEIKDSESASHADFIAGHAELAQILKCPVYISEKANAARIH